MTSSSPKLSPEPPPLLEPDANPEPEPTARRCGRASLFGPLDEVDPLEEIGLGLRGDEREGLALGLGLGRAALPAPPGGGGGGGAPPNVSATITDCGSIPEGEE